MTFTDWFSCIFVVLILGVDVILARSGGEANTISARYSYWSRRWPVIPFATGFIAGHLVWQNCTAVCP